MEPGTYNLSPQVIPHEYELEDFAVLSLVLCPLIPVACVAHFAQNQDSPGPISILYPCHPFVLAARIHIPTPHVPLSPSPALPWIFSRQGLQILQDGSCNEGPQEAPSVQSGASSTRVQHRPSTEARCKQVRTILLLL